MSQKPKIHQLKITLSYITPPIWRRIEVAEDVTLSQLALILMGVMGWDGGHLHQFRINGEFYGIPNEDLETIDECTVSLKDILDQGVSKFVFDYDFGDSWEHVVKVEKMVELEKGVKYPRCIKGARQCPPEDCGGVPGYEEFLKAMSDPKHSEHESMCEWIGGEFDPEKFDCKDFSIH
ncbi:hypothetical protein MNBD_UNCLBAC01-755 [hydrothermal vent metagenome]|uniref:Plasmid pRiA4b Orf3-like domain-containing protein n=1 Tax=hydrothermal vent metagenome TaxID=652676 RepID=A0A3B1D9G2_9ZZZZ